MKGCHRATGLAFPFEDADFRTNRICRVQIWRMRRQQSPIHMGRHEVQASLSPRRIRDRWRVHSYGPYAAAVRANAKGYRKRKITKRRISCVLKRTFFFGPEKKGCFTNSTFRTLQASSSHGACILIDSVGLAQS